MENISSEPPNIFIPAKCPNCGGELRVPDNRDSVKCMYCGYDILIHDQNKITLEVQSNIDNLLDLAITAHGNSNYSEAYLYYTKVLEEEPEHLIARYGKASCAGALSTLTNPRIDEMMSLVEECTNDCPSELRNKILPIAIKGIYNSLAIAYNSALEMYKEYIQDQNAWKFYNGIAVSISYAIKDLLNPIYDYKEYIDSDYRKRLYKLAIKIDIDLLNGFRYSKQVWISTYGWDDQPMVVSITPEYRETIKEEFNEYVELMKKEDPGYVAPAIAEKKKDCFIATATMGNYDHTYVIILREYRDRKLEQSDIGRLFVKAYYQVSPPIARMIKNNIILRKISLFLVIKPSVIIATKALSRK